jgi:hypothetical protein
MPREHLCCLQAHLALPLLHEYLQRFCQFGVRLSGMNRRFVALAVSALVSFGALGFAASAQADFGHVVVPGETLTSVAAADGLSIDALAAANNLSPTAELYIGQILLIPPRTVTTMAGSEATVYASDTTTTTSTQTAKITQTTPVTTTVQTTATAATPTPATTTPTGAPQPTEVHVPEQEIAQIASSVGVPPAFAEAIAWQESGWNNAVVSGVGAVGVMQIVPTTWSWIDRYLTPDDPLAPASAAENIRGGVLLLHALLAETGNSLSLTAAGYYQGLASIRKHGLYPSTQQYVSDVLALTQRFGG